MTDIEIGPDGLVVEYTGSAAYAIASGLQWATEPSSPIEDIKAAIELMKRPTRRGPLLVQTIPAKWLPYTPPKRERERFSGGVNLSAQARNAEREAAAREAQELIYLTFGGTLFCSPRGKEILQAKIREAGLPQDAAEYSLHSFDLRGPFISDAELKEARTANLSEHAADSAREAINYQIHSVFIKGHKFLPVKVETFE